MIMLIISVITGIIGIILLIISIGKEVTKEDNSSIFGFFGGIIVCLGFTLAIIATDKRPKVIDVYRGKTELVIHYELRDSVLTPTDSVVVFKKE